MMRRIQGSGLRLALVVSTLVVSTVAACTITVDFSPLGNDLSVEGAWLLNGVPADAASCADAGIATVRVVFIDGGTEYTFDQFTFACADGGFDTRPARVLDRGVFTTEWRAFAADGTITHSGGALPLDTTAQPIGGHVVLPPADFEITTAQPALTIDIAWDTDPTAAGAVDGTCAEAGVAAFTYTLTDDGSGADVDMMTDIACGEQISWPDLAPSTYHLYAEGADSTGAKRWMGTCSSIVVGAAGGEVYNCFFDDMSGG